MGVLRNHRSHPSDAEQVPLTALTRKVVVGKEVADGVSIEELCPVALGRCLCDSCLASSRESN